MGGLHQPIEKHELTGAYKRNPQRRPKYKMRAGRTVTVDDLPTHLERKPEVAEAWQEIVGTAPAGVIRMADSITLEVAATLLVEFRADPLQMSAARIGQLLQTLGKYGMTPSDRARLSMEEPPEDKTNDPWNAFTGQA